MSWPLDRSLGRNIDSRRPVPSRQVESLLCLGANSGTPKEQGRQKEILRDDKRTLRRQSGHAALLEQGRRPPVGGRPRVQGAPEPGEPRVVAHLSAADQRRERT